MTGRAALICALIAWAGPAVAQLDDASGRTAPQDTPNPYELLREQDYSGVPRFNFNFRHYDRQQTGLALEMLDLPPSSAQYILPDRDLIITAPAPVHTIAVNAIEDGEDGNPLITLQFYDNRQNIVEVNKISAFSTDGQEIPASIIGFEVSPSYIVPVTYHFVIDLSGSMGPFIDDIKEQVYRFAETLPGRKRCNVMSFTTDFQKVFGSDLDCTKSALEPAISSLSAGGGTDIYQALSSFYSNRSEYGLGNAANSKEVALIFTDGAQSTALTREVVASQKNMTTFVYWFGIGARADMAGIADFDGWARGGVESVELGGFLGAIAKAVARQQVVRIEGPHSGPQTPREAVPAD